MDITKCNVLAYRCLILIDPRNRLRAIVLLSVVSARRREEGHGEAPF
jgi:hypothetical protein